MDVTKFNRPFFAWIRRLLQPLRLPEQLHPHIGTDAGFGRSQLPRPLQFPHLYELNIVYGPTLIKSTEIYRLYRSIFERPAIIQTNHGFPSGCLSF